MHPIVARIHPGLRTTFLAFLVARSAVWIALDSRAGFAWERLHAPAGTPAYRALVEALHNPLWVAALGELLLFVGALAVYRFARRDGMPQTAERATWFWIATPPLALALPGSDFLFAFALVAIAMGWILRPGLGAAALCAAIALRPEAVAVWPALAWAWWMYREEEDGLDRMVLAAAPLAVFALSVLGAIFLGEPAALFAGSAGWRTDFAWEGFLAHTDDLIVGSVLLGALAVMLRMWDDTPRLWFWASLPVLILVAAQDPARAGVIAAPFAVPLYVQLAKFAQDNAFERAVLAASLVALTLIAATP